MKSVESSEDGSRRKRDREGGGSGGGKSGCVREKYRLAGKILAEVLEEAVERVKVGVPLLDGASFVDGMYNRMRERREHHH